MEDNKLSKFLLMILCKSLGANTYFCIICCKKNRYGYFQFNRSFLFYAEFLCVAFLQHILCQKLFYPDRARCDVRSMAAFFHFIHN